jgi:RNA polymerase sigma-70 factor (ECF subfamily)
MSTSELDEQQLVAAMLQGDEEAFRRFFDEYFPRVYRFALPRLSGDTELAREIAQATLTNAIRALPGFRGEAALFSWLGQICRRQIVDQLRARKRHSERIVRLDDSAGTRAVFETMEAPACEEPEQRYLDAEMRLRVHAVLDDLPSRYGDVLEWKYIEGRSVEEIGDLLGIGHIAAQSMLARARVAFRGALESAFGTSAAAVLASMRVSR